MTLDWLHFTPWRSLAGGALIGLAAALLVLANGRIAGISGILGTLVGRSAPGERAWRLAFLVGLLTAPMAWQVGAALPAAHIAASPGLLIAAGLLVGLGTRYASGCTSGHGVCGLSRGSVRSLAATIAFMAAGFATVFLLRHLIG
ncbi:YeeE/YedE family protein [uncultured Pseudacidovorax sp.]|uniref:YeeE/YedE family protein n=1 Tax=uncultured Pseudacidovorax sp. TaxID=679313 RepID=UPI0025DCA445|nr:YeeE/YedE family protein [uncultured Pseudacidovorax sp.]